MPPKGKAGGKAAPKKKVELDFSGLEKGMRLQADGGDGYYYAAQVVEVSTNKKRANAPVKVNFVGYTAASDVWCGGDQLRSKHIKPKAAPKKEGGEREPREARKVWMFALTGGPCGGKGSCQPYLQEELKKKGYDVYTIPEVPTIFFVQGGGCVTFPGLDAGQKLIDFETAIIQLQLQMEESFKLMARSTDKPSIILVDRGVMDIPCYLPGTNEGDAWKSIMKANKLVELKLLSRYAGVLHLQTAAIGAEKFYKSGNTKDDKGNDVFRRESAEEARELDAKVLGCWAKHRNLNKITNDEGATMADKNKKCLDAVLSIVESTGPPPKTDTQVTICPYFTVPEGKMDAFKANFGEFYKNTKKGTKGCLYYGFAVSGNQVFCRESYKDAEGVLGHLGDVKEVLGKAVEMVGEGGLKLACMGPAAELEKLKEAMGPLGCVFWESDEGSMWFGKKGGGPGKQDTHVTIVPYFTVPAGKMDEFKANFKTFYAGTKGGTRETLYYGFCTQGNQVFCREGYKSAEGCLAHLGDVKEVLDKAVGMCGEGGLKLAVMGPKAENEKLKEAFTPLGTVFWDLDAGAFWK